MFFTSILSQSTPKDDVNAKQASSSAPKLKSTPKYVQNVPRKSNVVVNLVINSLFAFGLYCLYKDYSINKAKRDAPGTVKIIDQPSNKVSKKELSEIQDKSTFYQVIHSLTYRDVSALSVTMGFLGYVTDVSRQSFGKQSLMFRTSLFSLFLFPSFSYLLYQYNYDKTRNVRSTFQ